MSSIIIRELHDKEIPLLEEFIYQAIFQKTGDKPLPRCIISQPAIAVYIKEYGKPDDNCLVAECSGKIVGMVWTRILNGNGRGFGNLDDETPEFALSLLPPYRGKGIGTKLMQAMLELLKTKGCRRASLAVQKNNHAVILYKKAGFKIVGTTDQEYIMLINLQ